MPMFKKFFSGKKTNQRQLESPNQLEVGDIVSLKYRESLPPGLRENHLEVSKIGTYEYASGASKEIVLKDANNHVYFMSLDDDDGDITLCFAIKIPRQTVLTLFDEDAFAQLWTQDWAELDVQMHPQDLEGWLANRYTQTIKEREAYYYDRDCLLEDLNEASDGEELRFHECEGDDDHFGLNVETGDGGSTDVFLQVYCPIDVIEEMWPHGD
jgi:hypothetical protein